MVQAQQIQHTQDELACQQAPEVSGDSKGGNGGEDKGEAHQKAYGVHDEDASCHAKSLKNTGKCGIQIDKRTDEAKGRDKMSCKGAVKKGFTQIMSPESKTAHTHHPQQTAVFYGAQGGAFDCLHIAQGIAFRYHGQQQHGYGACEGIWEKNKWHRHTCEYTVDA